MIFIEIICVVKYVSNILWPVKQAERDIQMERLTCRKYRSIIYLENRSGIMEWKK